MRTRNILYSAKPGIPGVSGKLWQIWICVASQ
jgi:hypothetical protein